MMFDCLSYRRRLVEVAKDIATLIEPAVRFSVGRTGLVSRA